VQAGGQGDHDQGDATQDQELVGQVQAVEQRHRYRALYECEQFVTSVGVDPRVNPASRIVFVVKKAANLMRINLLRDRDTAPANARYGGVLK